MVSYLQSTSNWGYWEMGIQDENSGKENTRDQTSFLAKGGPGTSFIPGFGFALPPCLD